MKSFNNIGMVVAALVFAAAVSVLPSRAQQKGGTGQDEPSAQAQNQTMSMPEMMRKMRQLTDETSQLKNSMHGDSQGVCMVKERTIIDKEVRKR